MTVREPTKKELLWEIRQLLYKMVYGNEAEGIKPLAKHKQNSNFDYYKSLEERIKKLEERVTSLEYNRITWPSIIDTIPSKPVPVKNPYEETPHIYCGHSDDIVMLNSSIDDPKIK